jgi:hypothetical protein
MDTSQTTSINNPETYVLNTGGIPVVQIFNPASIDVVSRTTQTLNDLNTNGFDVFQFHNTINDALRNGSLGGASMGTINSMMSTLPSDWQSKFTSDESGMNDLLNNVNGLIGLASSVWSQASATGASSGWSQPTIPSGWTYGNQQPSVHDLMGQSIQNNSGTYKSGMMDHPDSVTAEKLIGIGALGYKTWGIGNAGVSLLGDSEAAAAAGESALGALGLAGEGGLAAELGITAAVAGSAIGATEVAAAAVGLAAVGYGIYKAAGGTGSSSFLDKSLSTISSGMDWFLDNFP